MIRRIALRNFKCFVEQEIELARLNVFAGSNGTGKSTVIQALLALYQSVNSGALLGERLQLNGALVDLGTGNDVMYRRSDKDNFEISVEDEHGRWTVTASVPIGNIQHTLAAALAPRDPNVASFEKHLLYLSADRLGPQKVYAMNLDDALGNAVGRRGEFAPLLYGRSRKTEVSNELVILETSEKQRFRDVETQFTLWMRRFFPGFEARTEDLISLDAVMLGLSLQTQIGESRLMRPPNVGFGVSVAFPIVLCGLLSTDATTLIVENPEAHLHPSAQSLMGEFFARVAAGGTQVFVETHSDHVVNGIRIAFKNQLISSDDLRFVAFTKTDEYGSHRVIPIRLTPSGDFTSSPETFFDQADKDLKLIYGV
jgi:predicted ATPase